MPKEIAEEIGLGKWEALNAKPRNFTWFSKGEPQEDSKQGNGMAQYIYVLERSPMVTVKVDREKSEGISNEATAPVQAKLNK